MKIRSMQLRVLTVFLILVTTLVVQAAEGQVGDPPKWFNDKPKLTFAKLSAVDVKLVSAPKANEFVNFGPGVLDPFIQSEKANYVVTPRGLTEGAMHYTDRTYRIEKLPESLREMTLLRTMQGHKPVKDPAFTICIELAQPAYVFVAIDERKIEQWQREGGPEWIKAYSPTGLRIITDDPAMREKRPYSVVAIKAPAGQVKLGPSRGPADANPVSQGSMYFVFFGTDSPPTK